MFNQLKTKNMQDLVLSAAHTLTVLPPTFHANAEDVEFEEVVAKKQNHFIESNTQEISFEELCKGSIIPNFASNEETISHQAFITAVADAAKDFFKDAEFSDLEIRVSHPIKGRTRDAIGLKASELREDQKTIFYERMAFCVEIPSITTNVNGNTLALSIGGVRSYSETRLNSRKSPERFRIFIGFRNRVCTNLCISTDGFLEKLEVMSVGDIYLAALKLFSRYNADRDIQLFNYMNNIIINESQFCQIIGRMRLYMALPCAEQKKLPQLLLGDSQINAATRAYISDENFKNQGSVITGWQMMNLLNGAAKSSYIDNFLERDVNATNFAFGIARALQGDPAYSWFLG